MKPLSTVLALAILMSACSGAGTSPTSPTPVAAIPVPSPPPTAVVTYYMLSGVVFEITEAGQVPIEGVQIYCDSCGSPDGHTYVNTGGNGFYRLAFTANGVHPLFVTKTGYEFPADTVRDRFGRVSATVSGDTQFDVRLVRQ